ncbi:43619_t:CDS:2, partial [Gigaspora margarita]
NSTKILKIYKKKLQNTKTIKNSLTLTKTPNLVKKITKQLQIWQRKLPESSTKFGEYFQRIASNFW